MKRLTKRFTALAIAFVITLLSLPISTQAACSHQPNRDVDGNVLYYITDSQHYNICVDCCGSYNKTAHINDGSDSCKVCGVGLDAGKSTHTHDLIPAATAADYGYKDRFGHTVKCQDNKCIGEFSTHTNCVVGDLNGDGTWDCDYCGWDGVIVGLGCTHNGFQWYQTEEETHQLFCGMCGSPVNNQIDAHNDTFNNSDPTDQTPDGKCDVCGVGITLDPADSKYKHTHVWSTKWSHSDTEHFNACVDDECSFSTNPGSHDDSADGNGICDICGYGTPLNPGGGSQGGSQPSCQHTSVWFSIDEELHQMHCMNCQENFNQELHTDVQPSDGFCDGCGAAVVLDTADNKFKHTHTFSTNWYSDIRGHYHECTDGACTAGDGLENHEDIIKNSDSTSGADGICDECNYTMCTHANNRIDGYEIGPEGHKPFCADCGHTMIPTTQGPELHRDAVNNADTTSAAPDGKCDVCGATVVVNSTNGNLEHEHAPGQWTPDGPNHSAPCSGCSYIIFRDNHKDTDGDRVCNDCGANMGGNACSHSHFVTDGNNGFQYVITQDQHSNICADCFQPVNAQNHYDDPNDNDSVCDTCGVGLNTNGQHDHNFATQWAQGSQSHFYPCLDDKCSETNQDSPHIDSVDNSDNTIATPDGKCDACGYSVCTHASGNIKGYVIGPEGHKAVCADCEKTVIPEDRAPEAHRDDVDNSNNSTASADGKCDVCGATVKDNNGKLEHTHEPDVWTDQGPDHSAPCKGCNAHVFKEGHKDGNNDGECDLCQASMSGGNSGGSVPGQSCPHDGVWIKIDKNTHQAVCDKCSIALGSADPHVETDGDSRCDNCNALVVIENGAYVHNHNMHPHGWYANTDTHFYRCDTCGMTTYNFDNHADSDSNGKCDVCNVTVDANLEHHCPNIIQKAMDDMYHAGFCEECYSEFGYDNHVDNDNNDSCDDCNATLNSDDIHEHILDGNWAPDSLVQHSCECIECESWVYEDHEDNDNDEYCDICNGNTVCQHPGFKWYGTDAETHELHCGECGNSIAAPEFHADTDGDTKCDVCGVGLVNNIHTHVWSTTYDHGTQGHWQPCTDNACTTTMSSFAHEDTDNDGNCDTCGNTDKGLWCTNHWPNGDYARTEDYHYTVCGNCQNAYGAAIAHSGADGYRPDTNAHYPVCSDCQMSYGSGAPHADTTGDGYCDDCMLSIGANGVHTHDIVGWTIETQVHTQNCNECGQEIVSARQFHTDDGTGKCSVCKASLDTDGKHSHTEICRYLDNMLHAAICSDCGQNMYGGEHIDDDGNRICDECNHAFVTVEAELASGVRAALAAKIEAAVIKASADGDYTDMKAIFDAPDYILEMFVDNYEYTLTADPGAYIDAIIMGPEVYLEEDFASDADLKAIIDRAKAVVKDSAMNKFFTLDIVGALVYTDGSSMGISAYPLNGTQNFEFIMKLDAADVQSNRTWYVVVSDDEGETFTKLAESAKGASQIAFTHDSYYDYFILLYTDEAVQNPSDDPDSGSTPTPVPSATPVPAPEATAVPTPVPSETSAPAQEETETPTPAPSATPAPTPAVAATATPAPSATPAPAATVTPIPAPSAAPTPAAPQATEEPVEMPKEVDTTIADVVVKAEVVEAAKENVIISSGVAVIDKEAVEAIVDVTAKDEAVVIPLAQVTTDAVEKAEINTEALASVAEAKKDVVIEFTDFTIKLDAKAVDAITEQAQGENIEIRVVKAETENLTRAQQKKLKDMDTAIVISAQIYSDDEYIGKFKGGKATVMLPFEIEEGRDAKDYKVYYIDEKGDLKKVAAEYVDGHMVFTTAHFSEYVIAYEGQAVEVVEAEEPVQTVSLILIAGIVVLLAVIAGVIINAKRQRR